MNELMWELFEMVRDCMPPTAQNVERWAEWAKRYREHNPVSSEPPPQVEADEPKAE
jgi:hypothetical protein